MERYVASGFHPFCTLNELFKERQYSFAQPS
jgi:hypothetical protein